MLRIRLRPIHAALVAAALVGSPCLAAGKSWSAPNCSSINSIPSVSFTSDAGAGWATNNGVLPLGLGSFGIAALEAPNTMLTEFAGGIFRSTNGGCRWREYATAPVSPMKFAPASGTVAYGWSLFSARGFWRIDAKANPRNRVRRGKDLPSDVLGVGTDGANPDRVRVAGTNGQLYDTFDGGESWNPVGSPAPVPPLTYFAAFDPNDLDHVVIGVVTTGVWTTENGGASWTQATGLSAGGPRNSFNGVVNGGDGNVVYVMSLDLDQNASGDPSNGRHIYRSNDGGLTFAEVVDQGDGIVLTNGPTMATPPANPNVVYFSWGSRAQIGGVNLYRYDHVFGTTTTQFNNRFFEIRAFEFNPADNGVLYGGFEGE